MEMADREIILKVLDSNKLLRKLYEEHLSLEDRLLEFQRRNFLTPQEEQDQREIKLRKLRGVERMMAIISEYRQAA
ncbi:MAG: DUF465 domain-containing protein [Proteobacteria bacterium]|nr:MAG: DUF465 domain-containing protein [Pseudomonadota bacterium]